MKENVPSFLERRNADWLAGRSSVASGHLVLIVDDSDSDIFFLLRAFASSGVKNPIQVVRNGAEAMDYLRGEGKFADREKFALPCIVILDLHMPHPNGIEILKWKKTRPEFRKVLFVALSNFDNTRSVSEAYEAGASTFLSKPLQAEDVRNLVHSFDEYWLRKSQSADTLLAEVSGK
ncbi:MAG: response regulator with CheY-like receiver domain and winged-helix DNA-binding domain [Verrucomicrobiales bacterium]|jgi:CheY-like chemotaxis protein|nr:response regulator with CheY-like receiver domain and winged-helix DNA-binding domain [Verrucomicrobiales bacterium]